MNSTIALTGATGNVGGTVARRLSARGVPLRLIGRDPSRLPSLPGAVAAPAAVYGDTPAMTAALAGADVLFLVSGRESAHRVAEHSSVIDAAAAAGVRRIVYTSFFGASPECTFTFGRDHWHTEAYVRASGLEFTFLRDNFYLSVLTGMAGADRVIRGPAGTGRLSAVAQEDVADVAAVVLQDDAHAGATYDLTGPSALSLDEVAAILGRFSGRPVTYLAETEPEAYASRAHYGAAEFEVAGWVSTYLAIARGELEGVSDDIARILGRPARSFEQYLALHPDSYAHLG